MIPSIHINDILNSELVITIIVLIPPSLSKNKLFIKEFKIKLIKAQKIPNKKK